MDNGINRWLSFSSQVEEGLRTIDLNAFSVGYVEGLRRLISKLNSEIDTIPSLGPIEKQECYFRINAVGEEIRETAHFMSSENT